MNVINETLLKRKSRYGNFMENAQAAQQIKDIFRESNNWSEDLAPYQKQALDAIADKMSRILTGDCDYVDNWHDIVGYATLVENNLVYGQDIPPPPMPMNTMANVDQQVKSKRK